MTTYWLHDIAMIRKINGLNYPVIAICGSSGSGKTTLSKLLTKRFSSLEVLKTFTTRKRRDTDDVSQFGYLSISQFNENVQKGTFFLSRQGELPYYGYSCENLRNVMDEKQVPVFMFRHSGLETILRLIRNVYIVYIASDPVESLAHSKDEEAGISLEETQKTNKTIVKALGRTDRPYFVIQNTYNIDCFMDDRLYTFIERVLCDVR